MTITYKNGHIIAPENTKVALVDDPMDSDFVNRLTVGNYEEPIPPIVFFTKVPTPKWDKKFMEHVIDCCEKVEPRLHKIREIEVLENKGHFYTGNEEKTLQDFRDSPHIGAYELHGDLLGDFEIIFDDPSTEDHVNLLREKAKA